MIAEAKRQVAPRRTGGWRGAYALLLFFACRELGSPTPDEMNSRLYLAVAATLLASCSSPPNGGEHRATAPISTPRPTGATISASGYATLLSAPSSPRVPASRISAPSMDDEGLRNPDESATQAAEALHRQLEISEAGNYIGRRIVRDPKPRFAFQFRRDAAFILARHTQDPRFTSREGGIPTAELQPIFDLWFPRLLAHRLVGGGSIQEFDGVVSFDMTIDEPAFQTIRAKQGWDLPKQLQLNFGPPPNPRSVDLSIASLIRIFARSDRLPGAVLQAALTGRTILRDGCFRVADHVPGAEPLVLFDRDAELALDAEQYLVLLSGEDASHPTRVGESIVWAGPRSANEADAGVKALQERCGDGPIVPIGSPSSASSRR